MCFGIGGHSIPGICLTCELMVLQPDIRMLVMIEACLGNHMPEKDGACPYYEAEGHAGESGDG